MKRIADDNTLTLMALQNRRVYDAHPRQRERMTWALTTLGSGLCGAGIVLAGFIGYWFS